MLSVGSLGLNPVYLKPECKGIIPEIQLVPCGEPIYLLLRERSDIKTSAI